MAGQVAVLGEQGRQARETGKRRVGRQTEDQQSADLQAPVEGVARAKHPQTDLGQHRAIGVRSNPIEKGQTAHGQEQQGQKDSHHEQGALGPLGRGLTEDLHAIGNRFDAGHGRTAGAEGPQDQKQAQGLKGRHRRWCIRAEATGKDEVLQAKNSQQSHHHHEGIGGQNKQPPGLLEATQIRPPHQGQQQQRQARFMGQQAWQQRAQGLSRRHQAHRRGEGVIHQQCRRRHQPRQGAEVLPGHHIGTTTLGIGLDRLPVGEHNDGDQPHDANRDRQGPAKGCTAGQEQHPQGRLGRVGHRGEGIGGQDRQRNQAGEPLGISLRAR